MSGAPSTIGAPVTAELVPRRNAWRRLTRVAGLTAFVAAAALLLFLRPTMFGGSHGYISVAGESMEPKLHHGDLVVTKRQDSYGRGDVVAFRIPEGDAGEGKLVIHRIVGGSAGAGYMTQGDNRDRPDLWRPRPADVEGKLRVHVAGSGSLLLRLRSPLGLALAVSVLSFIIIAFPGRGRDEEAEQAPA
jgi:signal peptidase I